MKRLILATLLATATLVSSVFAKNVVFVDDFRSQQPTSSIIMDRRGELYPPNDAKTGLTLKALTVIKNVYPERFDFATLKAYYTASHEADPCKVWRDFHAECNPTTAFNDAWDALQQARRREIASKIIGDADGRDVVLIIHGFNNTPDESSTWYQVVEHDFEGLEAQLGRKIFPVRLYWDGLSVWLPPLIWSAAQFNGPWVGLELRRLLWEVYALDPKVRLRVLSHSSGAFVITNALGDASAGSEDMANQHDVQRAGRDVGKLYLERASGRGEYAYLPQDLNIRVAMLIPAQPLTAFSHFYQNASGTAHGDTLRGLIPERIVLGLSRRDFAAGKVFGPCPMLGDSCMAVRTNDTCGHLLRDLNPLLRGGERSRDVGVPRIYPVRFPWTWKSSTLLGWHKHAVAAYQTHTPQWDEFLLALLADDVGTPEGAETCVAPAQEVKFWNSRSPPETAPPNEIRRQGQSLE